MCCPTDQSTHPISLQQVPRTLTVAAPLPLPAPPVDAVASEKLVPRRLPNNRQQTKKRHDLLLFVHALIKCLDGTQSYKLRLQTKALVAECVKRNRMGDPNFSPLRESLEVRLRGLVGPIYWRQAQEYMRSYQACKTMAIRARSAVGLTAV